MDDPIYNRDNPDFISVAKPHILPVDIEYVRQAMLDNEIALGKSVSQFEKEFAESHQVKYASTCNSGTSALLLAYSALGLWSGQTTLIQTFGMIACVNSAICRRSNLIFCDSDPNNLSGNTSLNKIIEAIELSGTKPNIIVVEHIYGEPVKDILKISEYCKDNGIYLVEDCAESIYAKINGRPVGTFGDIAIFSMYSNKCVTSSEGGMCISNNKELIDKIHLIKAHAFDPKRHFNHSCHSYGLRMPNMNAALGLSQHRRKDWILSRRHEIRKLYEDQLKDVGQIKMPSTTEESSWWVMPIVLESEYTRDSLRYKLAENNVETRNYFLPMHRQKWLIEFILPGQSFHIADKLSESAFYLPLYPQLQNSDVIFICNVIKDYFKNA